MALSYAFDPTQGETPQTVAQKRQTADALAARIFGRAPQNVGEGLNAIGQALIARQMMGEAGDAQKAGMASGIDAFSPISSALSGGQPTAAAPAIPTPAPGLAAVPAGNLPAPTAAPAPDTAGKIYRNDEPSPLDPPSGVDRQNMVATILGEAANEPQLGKNAVASVIRSRAVDGGYGGDTPTGVVQAPNQFEPWNTAAGRTRMANAAANPQQAAAAEAAIASAYGEGGKAPEDPTEGMTHFYSPGTQAALGRKAPAWAGGESVTIGGHVFNSPDDAALPASAQPAQFVPPGQPQPPTAAPQPVGMASKIPTDQLLKIAQNPWLSDTQKSVVKGLIEQRMKAGSHTQETDANGNIWDVDTTTGQRTVALKASEDPNSVREYEYYKKNFRPTEQKPTSMDYDTWATSKARASATTVNNNIGGGSDKQIFDTFAENTKEARAAATGLTALRTARQSLQGPGGVITGFGADERLGFQKLGAALGLANPEAIQNTETFRAAIAPQVAAVLKSTVGTANISNSDREFAEKAAGGSIKLDAGSINRLLDIMEKASTARLQLHQEQLDAVYPDPAANRRERALFGVKAPEAPTPPAGSTKSGIKWSVE